MGTAQVRFRDGSSPQVRFFNGNSAQVRKWAQAIHGQHGQHKNGLRYAGEAAQPPQVRFVNMAKKVQVTGAAYGRRRDQDERFNRARAQDQEARGTGRNRAFGGMPSRRWAF